MKHLLIYFVYFPFYFLFKGSLHKKYSFSIPETWRKPHGNLGFRGVSAKFQRGNFRFPYSFRARTPRPSTNPVCFRVRKPAETWSFHAETWRKPCRNLGFHGVSAKFQRGNFRFPYSFRARTPRPSTNPVCFRVRKPAETWSFHAETWRKPCRNLGFHGVSAKFQRGNVRFPYSFCARTPRPSTNPVCFRMQKLYGNMRFLSSFSQVSKCRNLMETSGFRWFPPSFRMETSGLLLFKWNIKRILILIYI